MGNESGNSGNLLSTSTQSAKTIVAVQLFIFSTLWQQTIATDDADAVDDRERAP